MRIRFSSGRTFKEAGWKWRFLIPDLVVGEALIVPTGHTLVKVILVVAATFRFQAMVATVIATANCGVEMALSNRGTVTIR